MFFVSACSSDTIWETDTQTFMSRIRYGDTEFLRHIDYTEVSLDDIFALGAGAPFAMSFVFDDLGMTEMSLGMLSLEWEKGIGLWRMRAGEVLIDKLLNEKQYEQAREAAELYSRDFPEKYFGYRRCISAYYWQQKDRETLDCLSLLRELFPKQSAADGELFLIEAVSSYRLELSGWDDLFIELFQEIPSSGPLIRGYAYINDSEHRRASFSANEIAFFNARVMTATGRYQQAADLYETLLVGKSPLLSSNRVYEEIGTVFLNARRGLTGAEALLDHAAEDPLFYAFFSAAKLYRDTRDYRRGYELFAEARSYAKEEPLLHERSLWYEMDCRFKQDTAKLISELPGYLELWNDPAYFTDLFETVAAELAAARNWGSIWQLYRILREGGDPETSALLGHILLQAEASGFYIIPYDGLVPDRDTIRTSARSYHPYGYYHLLDLASDTEAAAAEETSGAGMPFRGGVPDALRFSQHEKLTENEELKEAEGQTMEFIASLFQFRLQEEAYRYALKYEDELTVEQLLSIAETLKDAGYFREAITLTHRGAQRDAWQWTRRGFELLFPRAYIHTLETEAERNGIDLALLTALIREESYFDPQAVSHAGALGLAQLMPATAADTARRMGIDDYDIHDSGDNVEIGAYFFGSLLSRFEYAPYQAVCAYNAGAARMRGWARAYAHLPAQLIVEAIPYRETRNHAKKVLVSAVVYGYLYENKMPADTIRHYFTGR